MSQDRTWVADSEALLVPRDRKRYRRAVALQMATSLLDLLGVLLVGILGVLATAGVQGVEPPPSIESILSRLGLAEMPLSRAALLVGCAAAMLLVTKSALALVVSRWVSMFLAERSAVVAQRLSRQYFALPLVQLQKHSSQWASYALTRGVVAAVTEVLTAAMTVRVETALLLVLGAGLILVDPLTSVFAIVYFGVVVLYFERALTPRTQAAGRQHADAEVRAIAAVQDGIATHREMTVAGRHAFFVDRFADTSVRESRARANQLYLATVPRYGFEIALVVGAALLVGVLFATNSPEAAVGSLALFLTASSRVMPSLLRLSGARLRMHGARGPAEHTFELVAYLQSCETSGLLGVATVAPDGVPPPQPAAIVVDQVSVRYPEAQADALKDVSFALQMGQRLALVGPTGAGKSTLADVILGVIPPVSGAVYIDGVSPAERIRTRPGTIAYVPQDVALISGTIRENVALGVHDDRVDDQRVWGALAEARLAEFVRNSPEGLDTAIGERGVRLSGGQRQRLGVARALYSHPSVLVMDEATSALDAETEHLITEMLDGLGSDVTTVTVAHRLATIRRADLVLYLEDGQVLASGSFDEVRAAISQFDRQANLLGL